MSDASVGVHVDVLVVGGGPVGLAAAIEARLAGLSVTLLEARDGEIDKACGEGLMPGALPMLERLGVRPVGYPLRGVSYRSGRHHVDHRFQNGHGMGVRRTVLHAALEARALDLGVNRVHARVDRVVQDAASVSAAGVTARWLLACDGLHSSVARMVALSRPAPIRRKRYGVRQHFAIAPWSDLIEVHYGRRAELYVTPVSDSEVGLAVLSARPTNFDDELAAIPQLASRLHGAETSSVRRGAGPFRQRTSARVAGRVLLVGDASGYVDAITGEGLRLGFAQARVAVGCILADRPADYEQAWSAVTRDFRVLTSLLVSAATSPLRGAIVPLASRAPGLYGAVVERLAR